MALQPIILGWSRRTFGGSSVRCFLTVNVIHYLVSSFNTYGRARDIVPE